MNYLLMEKKRKGDDFRACRHKVIREFSKATKYVEKRKAKMLTKYPEYEVKLVVVSNKLALLHNISLHDYKWILKGGKNERNE